MTSVALYRLWSAQSTNGSLTADSQPQGLVFFPATTVSERVAVATADGRLNATGAAYLFVETFAGTSLTTTTPPPTNPATSSTSDGDLDYGGLGLIGLILVVLAGTLCLCLCCALIICCCRRDREKAVLVADVDQRGAANWHCKAAGTCDMCTLSPTLPSRPRSAILVLPHARQVRMCARSTPGPPRLADSLVQPRLDPTFRRRPGSRSVPGRVLDGRPAPPSRRG